MIPTSAARKWAWTACWTAAGLSVMKWPSARTRWALIPACKLAMCCKSAPAKRCASTPSSALMDPIGPSPTFGINLRVVAERNTFARVTGRDTYNLVQTRGEVWDRDLAEATDLRIQEYFEDIERRFRGRALFPFQDRITPPDVPAGGSHSQRHLSACWASSASSSSSWVSSWSTTASALS